MAMKIATDYTNQQLTLMKRREMCMEMAKWKDEQFSAEKQELRKKKRRRLRDTKCIRN